MGVTDNGRFEASAIATNVSNKAALLARQEVLPNGAIQTSFTGADGRVHFHLYSIQGGYDLAKGEWFNALSVAAAVFEEQTAAEFEVGPPFGTLGSPVAECHQRPPRLRSDGQLCADQPVKRLCVGGTLTTSRLPRRGRHRRGPSHYAAWIFAPERDELHRALSSGRLCRAVCRVLS